MTETADAAGSVRKHIDSGANSDAGIGGQSAIGLNERVAARAGTALTAQADSGISADSASRGADDVSDCDASGSGKCPGDPASRITAVGAVAASSLS